MLAVSRNHRVNYSFVVRVKRGKVIVSALKQPQNIIAKIISKAILTN